MLEIYSYILLKEFTNFTRTNITSTALFIGSTILVYFLTTEWLEKRKVSFVTAVLWLLNFVLFVLIFALLFPITYGGNKPSPAIGLLAIGGALGYPFYILALSLIAKKKKEYLKIKIQIPYTSFKVFLIKLAKINDRMMMVRIIRITEINWV